MQKRSLDMTFRTLVHCSERPLVVILSPLVVILSPLIVILSPLIVILSPLIVILSVSEESGSEPRNGVTDPSLRLRLRSG